LYIVRRAVLFHEGALSVASTREAGTTFTVKLPTRPRSAGGAKAAPLVLPLAPGPG